MSSVTIETESSAEFRAGEDPSTSRTGLANAEQPSEYACAEDFARYDEERRSLAAHFDAGYYLAANPDVRAAGLDPLLHFIQSGWREGRNPSPAFDVAYYLRQCPDVAEAGINPLLHFVWSGAREGRLPIRPLDEWRRALDSACDPRHRAEHWAGAADRTPPGCVSDLCNALEISHLGSKLIVSVSHDDYALSCGGIQNVIGDEERAFRQAGRAYLHISPAAPLPILADPVPAAEFRVRLRLNGDHLGVFAVEDLLAGLRARYENGDTIDWIIHHFMGHVPELIQELIEKTSKGRPIVWTHDFFTLCPSYALLRNDAVFCGGPDLNSAACGICCYGNERKSHSARMRAFHEDMRPIVLSPSKVALDFWCRRGGLAHSERAVVPPGRLLRYSENAVESTSPRRHIRVAHLGARAFHKGWSIFEQLALRFGGDERYEFFQLGDRDGPPMPSTIRNIPVRVTPKNRHAMVEALAEARIDVVVLWSLCYETFSFGAHEALAAGAFVVSRNGAGNVWPAIQANAPEQGCAVETEAELFKLFQRDDLVERVAAATRHFGAFLSGRGTADWLSSHSTSRAELIRTLA